jgi:hypothetical protein
MVLLPFDKRSPGWVGLKAIGIYIDCRKGLVINSKILASDNLCKGIAVAVAVPVISECLFPRDCKEFCVNVQRCLIMAREEKNGQGTEREVI